jgi:restriction system protein
MKGYFRVMLGRKSTFAAECLRDGFIGTDFEINEDLSANLPDSWREFNKKYIPIFLKNRPEKTKIGAGLACGALWTVSKGIKRGDIVLSPDGNGNYLAGEVLGEYFYAPEGVLPHRRKVAWRTQPIPRSAMSESLQNSTGSIGTVSDVTKYGQEIEALMSGSGTIVPRIIASDPDIEDPSAFALEEHLEAFLVKNWDKTPLSKEFAIFEEEGEQVGQQYSTDAGIIDILAVSRDKKRILIIELKRGRVSDVVVGQVLRYMGYVREQIAESNQTVEGVIIGLEDDQKLKWAISSVPSISFYRYKIDFKLEPS